MGRGGVGDCDVVVTGAMLVVLAGHVSQSTGHSSRNNPIRAQSSLVKKMQIVPSGFPLHTDELIEVELLRLGLDEGMVVVISIKGRLVLGTTVGAVTGPSVVAVGSVVGGNIIEGGRIGLPLLPRGTKTLGETDGAVVGLILHSIRVHTTALL